MLQAFILSASRRCYPNRIEGIEVRIIKGAAYLYDKCKSIVLDPLTHIRIELDHKEQQKHYQMLVSI